MIKFSIITVCYNAEDYIDQTMQSVLGQTFVDYEYIIVDGNSKDKTLDIVNKYVDSFGDKLILKSEQDDGIYDAMNKGAYLAKGKWCLFLNASDFFYNNEVLAQISKSIQDDDEFIYGSSVKISGSQEFEKRSNRNISEIWKGSMFRHNSLFIPTTIMQSQPYEVNRRLRISADFDFIFRNYISGKRFRFIDIFIIKYHDGGISDNRRQLIMGNKMICLKYSNTSEHRIYYKKKIFNFYYNLFFKKIKKMKRRLKKMSLYL